MARQKTFGDILREARERKGMDVPTAARRLRIRPDILQVIEAADFSRMPPRGYTRNMVHAYARMVGLNPTDLTRMYLDDDHAFQMNQARASSSSAMGIGRQIDMGTRRGSAGSRRSEPDDGRILYDSRSEAKRPVGQVKPVASRRSDRQSDRQSGQYGNLYSGPSAPQRSKLPFIIIALVLVVVLVLVGVFVFGGNDEGGSSSDVNNDIKIPGLDDTSNPDTGEIDPTVIQNQQAIVITPDRVTFVYAVPAGGSAYIEVYETEGGSPSVAQTVQGPSEKFFEVTDTLTFVTTNPGNVIITEGGKVVEPTDDNDDGVYLYEVNFDEYLAAWKEEHQTKEEPTEGE